MSIESPIADDITEVWISVEEITGWGRKSKQPRNQAWCFTKCPVSLELTRFFHKEQNSTYFNSRFNKTEILKIRISLKTVTYFLFVITPRQCLVILRCQLFFRMYFHLEGFPPQFCFVLFWGEAFTSSSHHRVSLTGFLMILQTPIESTCRLQYIHWCARP